MPIRQNIKGQLGSHEINRLEIAYAKALRALSLVDRHDPITDLVAKKVVEIGLSGVTDPQEIADTVIAHFRGT
jgi:hypothetical protein